MTTTTPNAPAAPALAAGSPVYLSGPMFSAADLWQQQLIADTLEGAGFSTYLPQKDGIEVGTLMKSINGINDPTVLKLIQFVREIVFAMDMYQLMVACRSLVFNMDGRVPDDGSVSETAAAFTVGRPIVIFKTTPITMLGGQDNPMLSGLTMNWQVVDDVTLLPGAVAAAVDAIGTKTFTPPQHVVAVLKLGNTVWDTMPELRPILNSGDPGKVVPEIEKLEQEWASELRAAFPNAPSRA